MEDTPKWSCAGLDCYAHLPPEAVAELGRIEEQQRAVNDKHGKRLGVDLDAPAYAAWEVEFAPLAAADRAVTERYAHLAPA